MLRESFPSGSLTGIEHHAGTFMSVLLDTLCRVGAVDLDMITAPRRAFTVGRIAG